MALGYVRGGFGQVYERLADTIRAAGGELRLGQGVERIDRDELGPAIVSNGAAERFDHVIVSAPTSLFLRLAGGLPEAYRARYAAASPHLGAHCVVIAVESEQPLQQAYWLSICEPDFPFLAFIEHTNYVPREDFGGLRVCYLGSYIPQDHRYFAMDDQETLDAMWPAVQKLAPALERGAVRELHVSKAAYAQPVVTRGYRERQPPMETPWPDVSLANMGQVYPHDRGQNYSLLLGEQVAARALATLGSRQPRSSRGGDDRERAQRR
jgi:protoporphyrinogen oxidase